MPKPAQLEIKRHFSELSEKETTEVVETLADIFVDFFKNSVQQLEAKQEHTDERGGKPSADAR